MKLTKEKFARHYFLLTTQPDLVHRTLGVEVLEAAAKFEKSVAFVQKIDDFASFLTGAGVSESRINACKQFASHPAFEESLITGNIGIGSSCVGYLFRLLTCSRLLLANKLRNSGERPRQVQ